MAITYSDPDVDTDETTTQLAALTPTDNGVIIGNGSAFVVESGATLKTSLGLTIGVDVQAYDADLATWAGITPGTGIATALAVNVGTAGAPVVNGGALGTPSSGTLTSATGLPVSTGISGLGTGVADFLATPSSANLKTAITDETGSGALVFGTSPTITTPDIVGTTAAGNAAAGSLGEVIESTVLIGSAVSLTTATTHDVTSISLTAGDWDVWGNVVFTSGASTTISQVIAFINTTSATVPTRPASGAITEITATLTGNGATQSLSAGMRRVNVLSTTTVYLSCRQTFAAGTLSAYGYIGARRVR